MSAMPPVPGHEPQAPVPAHGLELLREMLRIRRFEETCVELYSATKIRGFLHLYIGEEAIAAGVMRRLRPEDCVVTTYRDHGHALARGVSADVLMAEMFGRHEGVSHGRGGSMHLFHAGTNFFGGNGIVGGGLPVAVGLALADRMQGRDSVTACFFGEGAMAEGEFHEAINLAALWRLPVLFLCENNHYAMGSALELTESQTNLALKAASYDVPAWSVDGMDVVAMEEQTEHALLSIRGGGGPVFLEARTYRFRAHSMYDPDLYRDKAEVREWKEHHDPIELFDARLRAAGMLDDTGRQALEDEIARELEQAIAFAEAGQPEPVDHLTRHLYAEEPA